MPLPPHILLLAKLLALTVLTVALMTPPLLVAALHLCPADVALGAARTVGYAYLAILGNVVATVLFR